MTKYKITIYTSSNDLLPECIMDEFMLDELINLGNERFIKIEDDTLDNFFILNSDHIVGFECLKIID